MGELFVLEHRGKIKDGETVGHVGFVRIDYFERAPQSKREKQRPDLHEVE